MNVNPHWSIVETVMEAYNRTQSESRQTPARAGGRCASILAEPTKIAERGDAVIGNTGKQRSEVGVPSELDNPGAGLQPPAMRPSLSLVLDQIVALTEEQNHLEPFQRALINDLVKVAGELPGAEFSLDPVLTTLTRRVLQRFRLLSDEQHEAMVQSVAATVFEDAACRQRAAQLWQTLQGMSSDAR